LDNLLSKRRKF